MSPPLRLLFFGTPDFALPTLDRLLGGPHRVVAVVSQPDRPRGRGRRLPASPVSERALAAGLPLLRPERVGDPEVERELREYAPDLGVVVAFGQFLPRRIRELPGRGYLINGHASLLPRLRGAAPIPRAILSGDPRTGISVMRVEREMDAGAVALARELGIGPEETAGELSARLARLCAEAVAEVADRVADGSVRWREQDPARATSAPRLERHEAQLDFHGSAESLARRVRALAPAPGAWTTWDGQRLTLLAARAQAGRPDAPPGSVRSDGGPSLRIACADGWLLPLRLRRAGSAALDVAAFLRGRRIPDGARLGPPAKIED